MKKKTVATILVAITCALTGLLSPIVSNAGIFDDPSACAADQEGVAADIVQLADMTLAAGDIFAANPKAGNIAVKLVRNLFEDRSERGLPDRGAAAQVLKGKYADAVASLNAYIAGLDKTTVRPGTEEAKQMLRDAAVQLIGCVNNLAGAN